MLVDEMDETRSSNGIDYSIRSSLNRKFFGRTINLVPTTRISDALWIVETRMAGVHVHNS